MLALAPRPTAVYLCVGATDMRKGFDGFMATGCCDTEKLIFDGYSGFC